MKLFNSILYFTLITVGIADTCAQKKVAPTIEEHLAEVRKYQEFDYLTYDYKYLDSKYKIHISDKKFQQFIRKYNFYPELIDTYNDSISVIMIGEFDNWTQSNIATLRITFSWKRLGYYLWLTPEEAEQLGARYSITRPYELYILIHNNQEKWDKYMTQFMSELRDKVYSETGNDTIEGMTNKEFLSYALVHNPTRIKDYAEVMKSNNKSMTEGCGKPDCCKRKGSTRTKCDNFQ